MPIAQVLRGNRHNRTNKYRHNNIIRVLYNTIKASYNLKKPFVITLIIKLDILTDMTKAANYKLDRQSLEDAVAIFL